MIKDYLRKYSSQALYNTWKQSNRYVEPHIADIKDGNTIISLEFKKATSGHNYANDYLTFVALEDDVFIQYSLQSYSGTLSYSTDNGTTWSEGVATSNAIYLNTGDKILFKGNVTADNNLDCMADIFNYNGNSDSPQFNIEGNIMSLLYGDNFRNQTTLNSNQKFYQFFSHMPIGDASNLILPATTLSDSCYQDMFLGCVLLTSAPSLPATTLSVGCYHNMFHNCQALTTAPELPATTLSVGCYYGMFSSCTSLTTTPELPATTLANSCYYDMFEYCTTLTTAPELPATTLAPSCYDRMFQNCTSLTTALELPATTLASSCYRYMFKGCTSLNYIKCLATHMSADNCTRDWVLNVPVSGTFVKADNMEDWTTGANGIPSGWTVQDAA